MVWLFVVCWLWLDLWDDFACCVILGDFGDSAFGLCA